MTYTEFKTRYNEVLTRYWELGHSTTMTPDEESEFEALEPIALWAFNYGDEHFTGRVTECGCL